MSNQIESKEDINRAKRKSSDTGKILSFGVNSALIAVHLIGNGVILSSFGANAKAASAIISSIQSVSSGSIFGVMLYTGMAITPYLATKDYLTAGMIIKSSWLIAGGLSAMASIFFLTMPLFMPHILNQETAKDVDDFFLTFIPGSFFDPVLANSGILIALIEKDWIFPLILTALYRLHALGFAYLFSKTLNMGAKGVGLGTSVSGFLSFIVSQIWLTRKPYQPYKLFNCYIQNLSLHSKSILKNGWKLALQRLTEWGNTAAITIVIGAINNHALQEIVPAIQSNFLISLSLQGMAQAAMVFFRKDCSMKKLHRDQFNQTLSASELNKFLSFSKKSKLSFVKNSVAGFLLSGAISFIIFLIRKSIMNLFLSDQANEHDANTLLLVMIFACAIIDSQRIIYGGMVLGWNDLLYPTLVSLVLMTFLGVTLGGIIPVVEKSDSPFPMFWIRASSILISSILIFFRFIKHLREDATFYKDGTMMIDTLNVINEWEQINHDDNYLINDDIKDNNNKIENLDKSDNQTNNFFNAVCDQMENKKMKPIDIKRITARYIVNNFNHKKGGFCYSFEELLVLIKANDTESIKIICRCLAEGLAIRINVTINNQNYVFYPKVSKLKATINLEYSLDKKYQKPLINGNGGNFLKVGLFFKNNTIQLSNNHIDIDNQLNINHTDIHVNVVN